MTPSFDSRNKGARSASPYDPAKYPGRNILSHGGESPQQRQSSRRSIVHEWSVEQVADWLKRQGLEDAAPKLQLNMVDGEAGVLAGKCVKILEMSNGYISVESPSACPAFAEE